MRVIAYELGMKPSNVGLWFIYLFIFRVPYTNSQEYYTMTHTILNWQGPHWFSIT